MSWTEEEWKVGLPSRALQKIAEREQQLEKLSKEKQQKQLQLEALETTLHKQKQKLDEGRSELTAAAQEKQSLAEAFSGTERARQRLSQELQVKDAQLCSLQGQLSAARKEISSLEQELKRCRAELEKLQASGQLREVQLFPTPPWSCNGSPLPAGEDINVTSSRVRDNGVSTGRQWGVASSPAPLSIRQQLQFSRSSSPLGSPHRRESPGFPWQEEPSPVQRSSNPRRGGSTSQFPWGQDPPSLPSTTQPPPQTVHAASAEAQGKERELNAEEPLRRENEAELRWTVSQLQRRVEAQQQEDLVLSRRCQDLQRQLDETRGDLAAREQLASKCQEELQRQATQQEQTEAKRTVLEQKLRHLSEELKCQRQNSETTRHNLEQKIKEKEKEHQQEVAGHQQQCLALEQQHLQECAHLRQELQQAKSSGHALQAQVDKLGALHQSGEKELEELRGAVRRAEQEISSSRSWVQQLQADLEAAKGREYVPQSVRPLRETRPPQEEESRRLTGKRSHRTLRQATARQEPSTEERWQDQSEEITTTSREDDRPLKTASFHNGSESGKLTADSVVEGGLEDTRVLALIPETKGKAARDPNGDCGALQPSLKKQCFEVCPGGTGPSSPEMAWPTECAERTFQSDREASAEALQGPEGWGQRVPVGSERKEGCRTGDRALQSELSELRQKLHEVTVESELRQKVLFEARWKLKQTSKKYTTETGRLKKQVLELMEKLSGLEADLESERCRSTRHQQEGQALEDQCRRLSELLESKEDIIQQMGAEVKTLERELLLGLEKVESKALEGVEGALSKSSNARETREEAGGLEGKAPDPPPEGGEGEESGSEPPKSNDAFIETKDSNLQVLRERVHNLEEHLQVAKDNDKVFKEVEGSEGGQRLCQEPGEPAPDIVEQKVKALQARCEMLSQEPEQQAPDIMEQNVKALQAQAPEMVEQKVKELQDRCEMRPEEPEEEAPEVMEQNVKMLQARCEILSVEKLEADARASKMQQKFNYLQATISLQTQQLTLAFETQTQNIDDLLRSLEEKEAQITTLNQTLEQYCQSLAHVQAENAELWAVIPRPSLEKKGESFKAGGASDSAILEYAVLRTKHRTLESCKTRKEEKDSTPRDAGNSLQEAEFEGLVDPEFVDERQEGWSVSNGGPTSTRRGSSLTINSDERHSPWEGVRGPVHQLDYLGGSGKNQAENQKHGVQGEAGEDQAADTPSRTALLKDVCLSQELAEKLEQGVLADPSRGLFPMEEIPLDLSTVTLAAHNQGKVRSSQVPAGEERDTVPPELEKLLARCIGLELERDLLNRKLLDLQLSSAEQQANDCSVELWLDTSKSRRQKGPEHTQGLRSDLDKAQKVSPLTDMEETVATRTVQVEAQEELHWQILQSQCCSVQRAMVEAQHSESMDSTAPACAALQHQVDVMCRMVSDLLDEKPPLNRRLKACSLGGGGDQTTSQNAPEVYSKALGSKTELLERGTSGSTSQDALEGGTNCAQSETELWGRDAGGETSRGPDEVKCRPQRREMERWEGGDCGMAFRDTQAMDSKTQLRGGGDIARTLQEGREVACRPLTELRETWGRGDSGTHSALYLENGVTAHTPRQVSGEKQAVSVTLSNSQGYWGICSENEGCDSLPERETPSEPEEEERWPGAERQFETKGLKRLPERGPSSEPQAQERRPEAERWSETMGLESQPEVRPSEPWVQEKLPEGKRLSGTNELESLPERERPIEPQIQESRPGGETTESLVQKKLPEAERQSEAKGLERRPETDRPSESQVQERLLETDTEILKRQPQGERPLEPRVQEKLPERETPSEPWVQERLLEIETNSLERQPEREITSEPQVQESHPVEERLYEPQIQETLPENERQSEKELGRLPETVEQQNPGGLYTQSVTKGEPETWGVQKLSLKESLWSQEVDNGVQPHAKRVSTVESQSETDGAALLCFSPGDLEKKPCGPDPGSPGTSVTRSPRSQTPGPEGSDRFDQRYADLMEGYRALQDINCTLSEMLSALQGELEKLQGATGLVVCHSETQTELLDGRPQAERSGVEGQKAPAWTWCGDPAEIAQRLQRQREKMSVAYDDTEYEPYGLPEVVMKGFADIPTGPACPYVLRRGLLGSSVAAMPKQSTESSSAPAGGSSV